MESQKNDNVCLKCCIRGRCCYFHTFINGFQVETDEKCVFLNDKGLCSIYRERKRNPACLSVEEMINQGTLFPQCAYVKGNVDYRNRTDRRIPKEFFNRAIKLYFEPEV